MRLKAGIVASILCGICSAALLLSRVQSAPPAPSSMPATQPTTHPAETVFSAADVGDGSLRSILRSAKDNSTVDLHGGRIVNRSDLILAVPGLVLQGKPGTRSQIGGRQTAITASDVTLRDLEFFGEPDENGRSVLVSGIRKPVSNVTIENIVVHAGGDDGMGCWGKFSNITIRDCTFKSDAYKPCGKAVILGADNGTPQPNVGAEQGYAATFIRCKLKGCYGNPRCSGGVYVFRDCEIDVTALGGAFLMGASVNFINCRFNTFAKPPDAPYWYRADVGPAPIVVSGLDARGERNANPAADSIYIENCSINGKPATVAELCSLSGPKGYEGVGTVPANVFRTKPW